MEDEEDKYWTGSEAKGFSWEEGDDSLGMPDLSLSAGQSRDDLVSFDDGPLHSDRRWDARVRDSVRQLAAANRPEPTISEMVSRQEPGKQEAEIKTLKRALEKLQEKRFQPDPPEETVKNILLGRPFSLESYRSVQSKEKLLDCAIEYGDGDAILAVTLMIKRTLKRQKFLAMLSCRPLAVEHLVAHMITRHEMTPVTDLLAALGRFHEAGVVSYRQAVSSATPEYRVRNLKQVLQSQLCGHTDADLVVEQIHMLERVSPIVAAEAAFCERPYSQLTNSSLLKILLYCCQYYWNSSENLLHSPLAIRKMHKLTEKQFTWVGVRGRAMAEAWSDCESLLVGKGWLGGVKAKGGVNMAEMVTALHDGKAPPETLSSVLQAVESPSDRLELGKKLGVSSVVVDVLLAQRDRLALLRFKDSLTQNSRDWFYADNALTTSNVKWKN